MPLFAPQSQMKSSLRGRVARLPNPKGTREALLPLWEAVINSIYAVRDVYGDDVSSKGEIEIKIEPPHQENSVDWKIEVYDNGIGLNEERFEAFCTADTQYRIKVGGKGVGRILWLAAFEDIQIKSVYEKKDKNCECLSFKFKCDDQSVFHNIKYKQCKDQIGTSISFKNLTEKYSEKFPKNNYIEEFSKCFLREFFAILMGDKCPKIIFNIAGEKREWPQHIKSYIRKKEINYKEDTIKGRGIFGIELLKCSDKISSGQKGKSHIHFLAHERIVYSDKLDGILGFGDWMEHDGEKKRLQVLISGDYLDRHVNQERTEFTFEREKLSEITGEIVLPVIDDFIPEPVNEQKEKQIKSVENVFAQYPSVAFDTPEEISKKLQRGTIEKEKIYSALSLERYRRDKKQNNSLEKIFQNLSSSPELGEAFLEELKNTANSVSENSQRSLAEYVVRRQQILKMLSSLLEGGDWNNPNKKEGQEKALHSLICPMQTGSVGGTTGAASHELWILDESLTFAKYYTSDLPFLKIVAGSSSQERPDLIVFDRAFSCIEEGDDKEPSKVMIVEFKRPLRENYSADENPIEQVENYMRQLKEGKIKKNGKDIKLAENCAFECYIIADVQGSKMKNWTDSLSKIGNYYVKNYPANSSFENSTLKIIEWTDLLDSAKNRNLPFFERMGLKI